MRWFMSVCVFSLHFRAQAWNFVKSIIRMQKVRFGSHSKILRPNVHFTDQTTGAMRRKKISQISLSYGSLERSCSTDKTLQKHHNFLFGLLKVIEVFKLLKSGGSPSFLSKKIQKSNVFVTWITCLQIIYIFWFYIYIYALQI